MYVLLFEDFKSKNCVWGGNYCYFDALWQDDIVRELRNVTEDLVVIDTIRYHVSATDGLRRNMSDMYVHVVDPTTKQIKVIFVLKHDREIIINKHYV